MADQSDHQTTSLPSDRLAGQLNLFETTMIVMGGIIGSGIFINPYVVAQQLHNSSTILAAWAMGGLIALIGAFVYAELAALRPAVGGQYAYLREAFHPAVAFIYGWTLLLVIQTGGMAAVAITFARYFIELTGVTGQDWLIAIIALALLTAINCLGVRAGSLVQSVLMVLKIFAILALVFCGFWFTNSANQQTIASTQQSNSEGNLLLAFAAALVPVLFAYGGWQTASFVAAEVREPRKNLPRALLIGVVGVILLYLAVNFVCIHALGADQLGQTSTPASAVMKLALGSAGGRLIAVAITISTLGFLSQGMLTAPRVYFAMAADRLFFQSVAKLDARRVPVVAILLQGVCAMIIALSGRYEQILNYVVSADFIFFGLTGLAVFQFRRQPQSAAKPSGYRIPAHPWTTIFFIFACWIIVINTIYRYPTNSLIGVVIMLAGIPIYLFWRVKNQP